jgi:lysophospholipase L1-like esterase
MISISPIGNPASNGTPQIIACGDSLDQGYQPTGNTPYTSFWGMQTWGGLPVVTTNLGVGGRTVSVRLPGWGAGAPGFLETLEADIIPYLDYNSGMNLVVFGFGTNDLGFGRKPIEVYSAIRAACVRVKQLGARVMSVQLISRAGSNGNGTYDEQVLAVNTYLRGHILEVADGFADIRVNEGYAADLDAPGAYANPAIYQADGIHLTTTGYQERGNVILAKARLIMADGGL